MQATTELTVPSQLNVYSFIKTQLDEVERLLYCCILFCHDDLAPFSIKATPYISSNESSDVRIMPKSLQVSLSREHKEEIEKLYVSATR